MKIIENNPYRILGVYANAPKKEILANLGKATAFLKVGKSVEFSLDLKGLLPYLQRTSDMISNANSQIAIVQGQFKYTQFWFLKITQIDDVAFNHLLSGNFREAESIWAKQDNISSLQNRLICSLIHDDYASTIAFAEKLYSKFGDNYIATIDPNSILRMTGQQLMEQFIDTLCEEYDPVELLGHSSLSQTKAYLGAKVIDPLKDKILQEVTKAKNTDRSDHMARKKAGENLIKVAVPMLKQLKSIIGANDIQYQMIADKVGLEVLQCGIDYYNGSEEDDAAHKAMKIQKTATNIVVGKMAKDRCNENLAILQDIIKKLPPKEVIKEHTAILKILESFSKSLQKMSDIKKMITDSKPHLMSMRAKICADNYPKYLELSTLIVNIALGKLISEVNGIQERSRIAIMLSGPDKRSMIDTLGSLVSEAISIMKLLDGFDMDDQLRHRYNTNNKTLNDIYLQILGIGSGGGGSSSGDDFGCWIYLIILGVIILISFLAG